MSYDGIPLEIFKGFSNNRNNEKNLNNNQSTLDHINYYNKSIVAKIYKSIGINDVSDSVLAYSSDIFSSYLECLFKLVHSYTELTARTKPNIDDVRLAFHDLGISINDILIYMERTKKEKTMKCEIIKEIKPEIDEFIVRPHKIIDDEKLNDFPEYIPNYLPNFPHQYTYMKTSVHPKRTEDPSRIRQLNIKQSRTVEGNLKKLMLHKEKNEDSIPFVNYELLKVKSNRK
ncbi:hypothetical protein H8356DRAFT_1664804 [Neocallimastix lanati (nom. inval.)]|jgi:transcription initiation factor TFIID subunit 3|uniref:Transcription initiation factor TFIID subunit 8 n=1 Tax=Neocallimastix californiae TaxID=1754190 RepID=A0A1Y2D5T5_9FUNG|nr:hypothetical protein H8356DRAFT_1664804 [Neocallimastix sp. JGI-2020a]ORY54456.1 hypothetical protein LY90DRAFT_702373 [Neocallimastix californiae]|eukprot:ORY54456.1 hypothetical protein LY90DRAFT_702373 [Neocallimastix californiae]